MNDFNERNRDAIAALPDGDRAVRDSGNPDRAVLLLAAGQ